MEQMAVLQETSYEQLYRWAQSESFVTQHSYTAVYAGCNTLSLTLTKVL